MQRCLFLQHSRAASLLDMVSTGILETSDIVTLPDIQQARERIRGVATRTPLYHFPSCD